MNDIRKNEDGLVAIVVSMMFIIILSLVVVSFSFFMRTEQQQILDRQLSTQAFFAAESGVNDYIAKILNGYTPSGSGCVAPPEQVGDSNASYTCVIINQEVSSIEYGEVSVNHSKVINLDSTTAPIYRLEISWEPTAGNLVSDVNNFGTSAEGSSHLPTSHISGTFADFIGIVRANVIPYNAGSTSRNALTNASKTYFLYPRQADPSQALASRTNRQIDYSETSITDSGNGDGAIESGQCAVVPSNANIPRQCSLDIIKINSDKVMLRISSIYQDSAITIKAFDSSGNQLNLVGAQAEIDSTGKANDVLRRIQVRIPLDNKINFPEHLIQSGDDFCKRLIVTPGEKADDKCPIQDNPALFD